jgi:cobalt/nickel transport system permease protein
VFQDGGLFALGVNIFNMGIIASFVGYYVYRGGSFLPGGKRRKALVSGGLAAWLSVMAASIACAFELAISGTVPLGVALPAMAGVYAIIGIGEGVITAMVLSLIMATRADLLEMQKA